jgi:eukaryotic translation initiation factor 2C
MIAQSAAKHGRRPTRILVLRDGLSEGQYPMAEKEELPAIRRGLIEANRELDPKITFLIVTKNHNKRVFRVNGQQITSSAIGDCVKSGIVREDVTEFFQQNHSPVKVSKLHGSFKLLDQ